ncbi:MAG: SoxR reducing system RseC family protein [Magnetococcales bacterium]|nr:SoxR reducing system RseC family protein [Magnetococcales bacterium]
MLREEGRVVALDGDFALVSSHRQSACGSCQAKSSCATLSGGLGQRENQIRAHNRAGAEVGERVVLEVSEGLFLKASFLIYAMPVLGLVFGGALARSLALSMGIVGDNAELVGALSGLATFVASFIWLRGYNRRLEGDDSIRPVITRVLYDPISPISPISPVSCSIEGEG